MLRRTQQILADVKLQIRDTDTYNNRVADAAMEKGRTMQRRVERTVVVVFLTFLFQAIYACMWAFAYSANNLQTQCGQCDECQDVPTVMSTWFVFNPAVRQIASFASAPAALLLALYSMVGKPERETLISIPAIYSNTASPDTSSPTTPSYYGNADAAA